MLSRTCLSLFLLLMFVVMLPGCAALPQTAPAVQTPERLAPTGQPAGQPAALNEPVSETLTPEPGSPGDVVVRFLSEYVRLAQTTGRPIDNPQFAAQSLLSDEYLRQYREILAGFDGAGYDPVLNAQMIPPEPIEVGEVRLAGDRAEVSALFGRGVMDQPYELQFHLLNTNGEWKIVPEGDQPGPATPEAAVDAFYKWYLEYIGTGPDQRNPLADGAYRAAPYLDQAMIAKADAVAQEGGYDPFLCAQDIPASFQTVARFDNDSRPVVLVESSFAGHSLTVDLKRAGFGQWAITNITCARGPAGTAKAFYTWMLGYSTRGGEWHNPWVEGAYASSPYLSQEWIDQVTQKLEAGEGLLADPALLAQDLPRAFFVEACPAQEVCALVNFRYGEAAIRQLRVELTEIDGRLRITAIRPASRPEALAPAEPVAGVDAWLSYVDEQYGAAIGYPAGWGVRLSPFTAPIQGAGPYARVVQFLPAGLDGSLIPIDLSIILGDEESVLSAVGLLEKVEELTINGVPGTLYRSDPGILHYIFQHPTRAGVWYILSDTVSQFPGREEAAAKLQDILPAMLTTLDFAE